LHRCDASSAYRQDVITNSRDYRVLDGKWQITGLGAILDLAFCSFGAYAAESEETAPMNKNQVEDRVDEAQGKVKEATDVIMDDKKMQVEGNIQKNVGKVQKNYGDHKQDLRKTTKTNNAMLCSRFS